MVNATRTGTTALKRGFNLIGNPYPSYLNWEAVYETGSVINIHPTIWYRTYSDGNMVFQTYNAALGLSTPDGVAGYIPPLQAFWIKVDTDPVAPATKSNGFVSFTNEVRAHANAPGNSADNRLKVSSVSSSPVVRLVLSNGENSDETVIASNPDASEAFDAFDSPKMSNDNMLIPEIYSIAGTEKLAINGLNSFYKDTVVLIGCKPGIAGAFTIKSSKIANLPVDVKVVLSDELTKTEQELTPENSYSFNSNAGETTNRFRVIFRPASSPSGINTATDSEFTVFRNSENQIVIDFNGSIDANCITGVYDLMGQQLISQQLTGFVTVINKPLPAGVYVVTVGSEGKSVSRKVVLY